MDHRQGAGGIPQVLRRMVRARRHRFRPPRPEPSVDRALERRQRDRRADHARRRGGARAGCWTSSIARTPPVRSPPATTTSPPTAPRRRSSSSTRWTSWATTTWTAGTSAGRSSPSRTGTIIPTWKMIGTESGSIFQSFDERYSLGDDPAGGAAQLHQPACSAPSGSGSGSPCGTTSPATSCGPASTTWARAPGRSRASPPGRIDITGHPKDAYYLYQSLWTDRPVLRLFPHWNWPGREGQVIPVLAYTNCNIVELFLNGRSLGEKRMEFPRQGTSGGWNTYAEPRGASDHQRPAPELGRALRAGGAAGGRQAPRRHGRPARRRCGRRVPPAAIRLVAGPRHHHHRSRRRGARDVRDRGLGRHGRPTADNLVRFTVTGGSILALDNADLQDLDALPLRPPARVQWPRPGDRVGGPGRACCG